MTKKTKPSVSSEQIEAFFNKHQASTISWRWIVEELIIRGIVPIKTVSKIVGES